MAALTGLSGVVNGQAPAAPQPGDALYCGRVFSLTCDGRNTDAQLWLETVDGTFVNIWIGAGVRPGLLARVGECYQQHVACVAKSAAPGLKPGEIRVTSTTQLTLRDEPSSTHRDDLVTSCDPTVTTSVRRIHHVPPLFPVGGLQVKMQGKVVLHAIVEPTGEVSTVRVMRPVHEAVDAATIEALKQWRFLPALRGIVPVAMPITVEMAFMMAR